MLNERSIEVEEAVRKALTELVSFKMRGNAAYIQMPISYDSGSSVVIEVREAATGYLVTDIGGAFEEADTAGASATFTRIAKLASEETSVSYANETFFLGDVAKSQLTGAVIAVAACSHRAASRSVARQHERAHEDQADVLFRRLKKVFTGRMIARQFTVRGSSNTQWTVDVAVANDSGPATLFDAVSNHPNSIYPVVAKFHDLALLEKPPKRIASVHSKESMGTLLGVLSQASSIIQETTSNETIRKIAG